MNGFAKNKKFITTAELKDMGYSYYKIGNLEKNGFLRRINRSTYENLFYKGKENDFSVQRPLYRMVSFAL